MMKMKIKTQSKLVNEVGDMIEETWFGDVSFMNGPNRLFTGRNGFLLHRGDIELVVSFLLTVLEKQQSSKQDSQPVHTEIDGA